MPFLAPLELSADAVWQAEWASTVWQREGRKGRCESDLGPQPLCMDRPANCINKCLDAGPVGGQGQGAAPIPTGSSRHEEGDHGQGCGPGLRPGFPSSSCSKSEVPVHPVTAQGALSRRRQGFGGLSASEVPGDERRMGWRPGTAPIRDKLGASLFQGSSFRAWKSCVAGREPSKPFYSSTSSMSRTQEGQEGRAPFPLIAQPRPGRNTQESVTLLSKRSAFEFCPRDLGQVSLLW